MQDVDPTAVEALDAAHARTVHAVAGALEETEATLRRAVAAARAAGSSWADIGATLNTLAEAARRRFGDVDHD